MTIRSRSVVNAGVAALAAFAMIQAATTKYYEKEAAIRKEASAELQKLGITRDAAKAKYPTPEISMVSAGCLAPGTTGEVVVKGKFVPGTKFVIESDGLDVTAETLTATEYRATVKVGPDNPPHAAPVVAISPVTGISTYSHPGVAVGGKMEWNIEAANGWKIVARSPADRLCDGKNTQDPYEMQFFRKGEAKPFETRSATGNYQWSNTTEYFTISSEEAGSPAKTFEALVMKMQDPKLTASERDQIMAEVQKAQQQMMASMQDVQKFAQEAEAKRKAFGCERMEMKLQGATFTGEMRCSEAVGTRIQLTGALKSLGR